MRWSLLFKITKKDWREIKSNKQIIIPMIIVPLLFAVVLPFFIVILPILSGDSDEFAEFGGVVGFIYYMANSQLMPSLVMIPLLVTMAIAADSWAGEKERKTAESILLLPVSDGDLLVAKILTSFIPGMIITLLCGAGIIIIVDVAVGFLLFPDWNWIFMLFILTPLLTFMSVAINVWISTRAKDTKSAQQMGGFTFVLYFAVLFAGLFGVGPLVLNVLAIILAILDVVLLFLAPRMFSRETLIAKI